MRYKGKVYRPPSEAYSLIVQVTYGCSHNRCAFCDMYDDKHFAMRPMDEIREDFELGTAGIPPGGAGLSSGWGRTDAEDRRPVEILGLSMGCFRSASR